MSLRPLGLAPLGFLDLSPPDFIAIAGEAGFTSVAVRCRPAVAGGPAFPMPSGDPMLRETCRMLKATGVAVSAVEQFGLTRALDIDALRPVFETAAALGASQLVCSGDEDLDVVVELFSEFCDAAGEFGLSACLEYMPFRALRTLEEARTVIDRSGKANARICIDTLHEFRSGGSAEAIEALDRRYIGAVQICDAPAASPPAEDLANEARERRLLPGDGELPLQRIVACLPAEMPLDAEVPLRQAFPDEPPLALARRIHKAMRALLTASDA